MQDMKDRTKILLQLSQFFHEINLKYNIAIIIVNQVFKY